MNERIVVLTVVMLICSVTDLRIGLVYDRVTIPAFITLMAIAALQGDIIQAAAGAAVASGILFALHSLTRGRGMGLGDVKLAAVIGAGVGAQDAVVALGCAFVLGALVGVTLIALRRAQRESEMRFAPFLAAGVGLTLSLGGGFQ